ncbi:hypothetical protein ACGFYV_01510 [Streptomyces sp. NPDC048297]|uniref:hypothetical protein n=1 Tax=Streptomyces sp. NPDC048297 TaxID=3365531 RepID=UPI003721447E
MNEGYRDVHHNYNMHFGGAGGGQNLLNTPSATPRRVAEDQLVRLQRQFARPKGINDAYDLLANKRTVIVHGEPGSGRSSAARVLLCELPREGGGTYHELTPDKPEGNTRRLLAPDLIGERDRMLLDLSAADGQAWLDVQGELSGFRHEVLSRHAYLAIVPPHDFRDQLSSQFAEFSWETGEVERAEALVRHLRLAGVDEHVRTRTPPALLAYLAGAHPLHDLARLAERIAAAPGTRGFAARCEAALAAHTDCSPDVDKLVPQLHMGRQRALFLTTAMLHGARAEVVHDATNLLVNAMGSEPDNRPLLEHKGLSRRLDAVDAGIDADSRVRFTRSGFAVAARRHFWHELPDIRNPLTGWLTEVLALRDLHDRDLERMVERYTELCLRTRDLDRLTGLVTHWTRESEPRATEVRATEVRAAAHLLKHGVEDESAGGAFRAKIYSWSTSSVTRDLRQVLTEVCAKVMSVHHPEPALVRLHHLARNEPPGSDLARSALLAYVNHDSLLQRRLLARIATAQSTRHHRADVRLFLGLVAFPGNFLLARSTRNWLTACWRMTFDLLDPDHWASAASNWLTGADAMLAVDDEPLVDAAVGILVDASDTRYRVLSRIYADARRTVSPQLASRLLHSINTAQRERFVPRSPDPEVSPS